MKEEESERKDCDGVFVFICNSVTIISDNTPG